MSARARIRESCPHLASEPPRAPQRPPKLRLPFFSRGLKLSHIMTSPGPLSCHGRRAHKPFTKRGCCRACWAQLRASGVALSLAAGICTGSTECLHWWPRRRHPRWCPKAEIKSHLVSILMCSILHALIGGLVYNLYVVRFCSSRSRVFLHRPGEMLASCAFCVLRCCCVLHRSIRGIMTHRAHNYRPTISESNALVISKDA